MFGNPFETAEKFERVLDQIANDVHRKEIDCDIVEYGKMVCIFSAIYQLKGKQLACWCRLDKPCHADVLAKFAERLYATDTLLSEGYVVTEQDNTQADAQSSVCSLVICIGE